MQDGPGGFFDQFGFGIYDGQRTTWAGAVDQQVGAVTLAPSVRHVTVTLLHAP